jgi:LuxR family transcriptional regulator, maltose regulon positive regulatory protein
MTSATKTPRHRAGVRRSSTAGPGSQGLIRRNELLATLDRAVAGRVTILSAPPGSGKTSLLRTWVDRSREDRRVAFVSVPRDERDAQQFWLAVLDAIRRAGSDGPHAIQTSTPAFDGDAMVDRIVAELAKDPKLLVLIIDDLHELSAPDALGQLERLLAHLPSSVHLVLSTRRDPRLRLHQLRLAGELTEIRAAELRFSERETRELVEASGVRLSDGGAAALHERTEGWAAGLRLAALSLRGHVDPDRFVAEFSGSDMAVGEYLIAEMLERQPDDVQRLLLRTSIVDRVNGELGDLLAGHRGSVGILLELEDANAFVVSLDGHRTWFRYHQLLSDFLRLELRRTAPDEVPSLHRRAAAWFLERGHLVEAVQHMQAAGDWLEAARMLADHVFSLAMEGHADRIAALLASFPQGVSDKQPELELAFAVKELLQGRLEEAAAQLTLAESHIENTAPERRYRLTVAIAALRLAHARRTLNLSDVIGQISVLASPVTGESSEQIELGSELRGVALMNLGIAELWSGRLADAERHLLEGATLAERIGQPYLEVTCRAQLGFPSKLRSFTSARERCREAIALAERHGWEELPVIAPALATLAGTTIWMGELAEGEQWLRRAWKAAQGDFEPATAVLLHVATGMMHSAGQQNQLALAEFEAADRMQSMLAGEHVLASQVSGWLAATQARLGMPDRARASLTALPAERARMGEISNARAVTCLVEGDPVAALEALRGVLEETAPVMHSFTLVEADLLAGRAYLELGDRRAAAAAVEAALACAEPDRLILPFAMTGSLPLLDVLPRHETNHSALLVEIVDLLQGGSVTNPGTHGSPQSAGLSRSELRVLRYLPTNLTRSEIAQELYVSVNTVNTHLRNIYSKLGAQDRSAAVQQARQLRLLSAAHSLGSAK